MEHARARRKPASQVASEHFDVALSFAGEDRDYVEQVASSLKAMGLKVFYDKYETVSLWGKDLYAHLCSVYRDLADYTVVFISKHYKQKLWTRHELKSAQARAFRENREYILPARFDETPIPGVLDTVGHVDLRKNRPADLAKLIKEKVGPRERYDYFPDVPDRLFFYMGLRRDDLKRTVGGIARNFHDDLCLMRTNERRLIAILGQRACECGMPANLHMDLDVLVRVSERKSEEIASILSRLNCLGVQTTISQSHETLNKGVPKQATELIEVKWHSRSGPYHGDATTIMASVLGLICESHCERCGMRMVERNDFSSLSSLSGHEEKPGLRKPEWMPPEREFAHFVAESRVRVKSVRRRRR